MKRIYLDNSSTTKPDEEVLQKSIELYTDFYGNASSLHTMGIEIEREIKNTSQIIGAYMGVDKENIIFTSGGTESNNIAIQGVAKAYYRRGTHIVTTTSEHASVKDTVKSLSENGYTVTYLNVNEEGRIDINELEKSITNETILASIMHVNNETGVIHDINKIGEIIKSKNKETIFHVDGVQAFGKIKIKLNNIDMYSISSHKIHGLKGTGALFIKKGIKIKPLLFGGQQQKGIRVGTENSVGIVCFGLAASIALNKLTENYNHVSKLKHELLNLKEIKNVFVNGNTENDLPYILNMSFEGIRSEILLHALECKGVFVSSGSACNSKKHNKSILYNYGLNNSRVDSAIRFSFSKYNTLEEIQYTLQAVKECVNQLKR